MESTWLEGLKIERFPELKSDIKTDVLIIGGGLAGVLCAYFLEQKGVNYTLVEGERIGMGITKNTTAKITFGHSLIYSDLIENFGEFYANQYLKANKLALDIYARLCKNTDCDFEKKPAYTYSLYNREKIENEIKALQTLGCKTKFESEIPLPFKIAGAIKLEDQAQFNPMKFISQISKNLNIYENTYIREVKGNIAFTGRYKITAGKIIVATHFPFINLHGSYFLKMYQNRSYVVAIENGPEINGMYVDEAEKGMSFRNYKNLLLVGGGSHRTGKNGGSYNELREFIKKHYKNSSEKYFWATQDCMTLDGIPYIGQYSKNTPDLFVATGFNKWGMTSSMVAAMILCDLVIGKENEFEEVFSPSRNILKPQLFVNVGETLVNFLTPTPKRCSHLGCSLKWNKYEHTWDCPCHGSRFEEDGRLIDNPAMRDTNV